jgi:N-glycosylase/DNA lyase
MVRGPRLDQVKAFCGPNKLGPPNNMTANWDPVGSPDSISLLGLKESLLGGQSFSWSYLGDNKWVGVIRRSVVHLRWENGQLYWCATGPVPLSKKEIEDYLWLDDSYCEAVDALPWRSDKSLDQAIKKFSGLRVLRQPTDETLLVFLLSSAKSIPQIKQIRHRIHLNFGEDLGEGMFAFPGWERLSKLSETDARNLGMGYRAKYLVGVAQFLCQRHGWLEEVSGSKYKKARSSLMELPGVGPKVADCVLLFGAGKSQAFPIDTWILQALERQYGMKGWTMQQMQEFAGIHFGHHAGLAQQFLFSFQRSVGQTKSANKEGKATPS